VATERDEVYWLKGTIQTLQSLIGGLEYELRMRDIRIEEQASYIAQLEKQVQELKRQATASAPPPSPGR
jgi:hypothetical protein